MTANTCNGDMLPVFRDQSIHVNTGMITPRLMVELRCKDREKQSRLPFIANPVALRDATRCATDPCGHTSLPMQNSGKGRAPKGDAPVSVAKPATDTRSGSAQLSMGLPRR
jgi:hypothetical protein